MPLLTVRLASPMENVIRVQLIHHKGTKRPKPEFMIYQGPTSQISISNEEQAAILTSGDLSLRVNKGADWLMEFIGKDQIITSSGWRGIGFVDTPDGRHIHEQLSLGAGECVYGLGERFTAFVKNGQVIDMLRATMLEFPDDPACNHLDLQYMLGDSLLVAPILATMEPPVTMHRTGVGRIC